MSVDKVSSLAQLGWKCVQTKFIGSVFLHWDKWAFILQQGGKEEGLSRLSVYPERKA
jgi:hypothetical protein